MKTQRKMAPVQVPRAFIFRALGPEWSAVPPSGLRSIEHVGCQSGPDWCRAGPELPVGSLLSSPSLSSVTGCFIIKIWCWCCQEGNISLTCKKYLHVARREGRMWGERSDKQQVRRRRTKYLTTVSVPRKLCGIFGSSGHDFAIIISRARGATDSVRPITNYKPTLLPAHRLFYSGNLV